MEVSAREGVINFTVLMHEVDAITKFLHEQGITYLYVHLRNGWSRISVSANDRLYLEEWLDRVGIGAVITPQA